VFLTVLDPSSVQNAYRMRSISKSGVRVLTGRYCDPGGVGVGCVSGLAHSAGRRAYYITENATVGDQRINDRKTEAHIWAFWI